MKFQCSVGPLSNSARKTGFTFPAENFLEDMPGWPGRYCYGNLEDCVLGTEVEIRVLEGITVFAFRCRLTIFQYIIWCDEDVVWIRGKRLDHAVERKDRM